MGFIPLLSSVNLCFALMKRLQCHVYMDSGVTRKIKCLGGGFQRYLSLSVNKETEFSFLSLPCCCRRRRNVKLQWTVCGGLETNYKLSSMAGKRACWDWRCTCRVITWFFQKCLKLIVAKEVKCGKPVSVVVYRHPFQGQMGLSDIKIRLSK